MTLLNQWKNKQSFGLLTYDICVWDDKFRNIAAVLRAHHMPHATVFVATSSSRGKERGEKALRGAGSWSGPRTQSQGPWKLLPRRLVGVC